MITDVNKVIIKNFWNDFASRYKLGIITAFFLLILVAATASVYPYLIQLVFDGLLNNKNNLELVNILFARANILHRNRKYKESADNLIKVRRVSIIFHIWLSTLRLLPLAVRYKLYLS